MQGVVGKVQLSKLDTMLLENKKRYLKLSQAISGAFKARSVPAGSEQIHDTYIFFVEDQKIREGMIDLLNKEGFGTKNLPDAIEWHCAAFWDHALPEAQINAIEKTKLLLNTAIAVPIWLRKSEDDYTKLGEQLCKFAECELTI